MSNTNNLIALIAKKSRELAAARSSYDVEAAERLEDELNDLEDALEESEADGRDGGYGWG